MSEANCATDKPVTVLNVLFDLPDLSITGGNSFQDPYAKSELLGLPSWEFSFNERQPMGLSPEALKQVYVDQQDILFLHARFLDRHERDKTITRFRPHVFAVKLKPTYGDLSDLDQSCRLPVFVALVYRVKAEMEMRLRQTFHRQPDPRLLDVTLYDYEGNKLASTLSGIFLTYSTAYPVQKP